MTSLASNIKAWLLKESNFIVCSSIVSGLISTIYASATFGSGIGNWLARFGGCWAVLSIFFSVIGRYNAARAREKTGALTQQIEQKLHSTADSMIERFELIQTQGQKDFAELQSSATNNFFRIMLEITDNDSSRYWRFVWRFESLFEFDIRIESESNPKVYYRLRILGKHISEDDGFEYFICEIVPTDFGDSAEVPFREGDTVACFWMDGPKISSDAEHALPEKAFPFGIVGFSHGARMVSSKPANSVEIKKRLIDLIDD